MPKSTDLDKLLQSISLLKALRNNVIDLKEYNDITESHVNQFHTILLKLQDTGVAIADFFIDNSEIKLNLASINTLNGTRTYSDERYVRKSIFLTKLDGIIGYLEYILKEPERHIGYNTPK